MSFEGKLFVGLIPDGDRRWAKQKHDTDELDPEQLYDAYASGAKVVEDIVRTANTQGDIGILAAWGASCKNFDERPENELQILYGIYEEFLTRLKNIMDEQEHANVRFAHLGRRDRINKIIPNVAELIDDITTHTRNRSGMIVAVCLDYDSSDEIMRSFNDKAQRDLPARLDLTESPELDLIIRTGVDTKFVHDNGFLSPYDPTNERRILPRAQYLPAYSAEQFSEDIEAFRRLQKRKGA